MSGRKPSAFSMSQVLALAGLTSWYSFACCHVLVFFVVLCVLSFVARRSRSRVVQQVAFPAWPVSPVRSVFVDSGSYPHGIYNSRDCFADLDEGGLAIRICGLFSSAASAGRGTVTMWLPVVRPGTKERKWFHLSMADQIYQKNASTMLFSTQAIDLLGHVPFLTRYANCIVLADGWVAPLSPDERGYYLDVVFAPATSPPSLSLMPHHVQAREVHTFCVEVAPRLSRQPSSQQALTAAPRPQVPALTDAELRAWRMMGFPFNRQWRWAYDATTGHGLSKLPNPVHMFTDLHVLPARMRALPFHRSHAPREAKAAGALVHIDFHTGLPPSHPQGYLHHCSLLDDYTSFGHMYPTHQMTARVALECLKWFHAYLQRECGRSIKILVVRCDNKPFDSQEFRDGCANYPGGPIHVVCIGDYMHQQAGRIERYHGVRMSTARVLLRYAKVPGTWWPYATNHANVIHNLLPSSRDRKRAPLAILRDQHTISWQDEHADAVFGHFSMVWLAPPQRGETGKQLADRARPAIYLGRSTLKENSEQRSSHFFMIEERVFHRATHFRIDYDRPPPGWPMQPKGLVRSVDVLSELLAMPDTLDIGSYLLDELPLPTSLLPAFDEQEGGDDATPSPNLLLENLPSVGVTPIIPNVSTKTPLKDFGPFELTPAVEKRHPGPPVLDADQFEEPQEPNTTDLGLPTQEGATVDPLSASIYIESHGDDELWSADHCPTAKCQFKRGHSGPCSIHLPEHGRNIDPHVPPSKSLRPRENLRPRQRAHFTNQESQNLSNFCFQFLALMATSTSDQWSQEGAFQPTTAPYVAASTLFASAYDNMVFLAQHDGPTASSIPIPRGIRQALACERREFWLEAICKEYTSILSHDVFTVVRLIDLPPGTDVMRCHCIFTVKSNKDGSIERYKARLVADGNTQTHGVNFQDIFATVVKFSTFRMALHLAAVRDYIITAIDISTAFLYGKIDNPNCYMRMPEGLPRYDADGNELVCHLRKSIYGLRQAPRIWFNHFKASLIKFGFTQSQVDPCLFIYNHNSIVMYGLLWVDDLVIMTNDNPTRDQFVDFLKGERQYTLTDKGEATWLLGIALSRDREKRTITLSQKLYIQTMLTRFSAYMNKANCRNFDVPALEEINSFHGADGPAEGSTEAEQMKPLAGVYLQIIGCLIWLTSCTLPHLLVATNVLSRRSTNPSQANFAALMRVLLYISHHPDESLVLGGTGPDAEVLQVVTDASHEAEASLSGVLIVMGSAAIDWICRRQKTTSKSSLESEAKANAEGAMDGVYKRELAAEFGVEIKTTNFWTDSDSSIKLHKDQYACKKSKHIIRVIAMLREWVLNLVFCLCFIPGTKNYADLLTKPLSLDPFRRFRNAILNAEVVLPAASNSDVSANYLGRLSAYFTHAVTLPDEDDDHD